MAYRVGFCPQCGVKILVQNTDGRWDAIRKNFAQIILIFADGHRVKCPLDTICAQAPNLVTIFTELTAIGSEAADSATLAVLADRGIPTSFEMVDEVYSIDSANNNLYRAF